MHYFFVLDENNFIDRCHVCNSDEYDRYLTAPERKIEVTREEFDQATSRPNTRCRLNESGGIEFVSDSEIPEIALSVALAKRARLLSASDWTQLPDVPLTTKAAWATYRQALRDITAQPGYPLDIVWPVSP